MSEKAILQAIKEAEPVFKPADKEELAKRREANKQELLKKGLRPPDEEAVRLDVAYWRAENALENRLRELEVESGANERDGRCVCEEIVDALGEEQEATDIPGESGYLQRRCLRCGGYIDAW